MQGLKDVRDILVPGMYGAVVDISDAYYHISIHKKARKYCRFIVDGEVYEYLGLPMGLTCSPRIFTRVSKAAADWLRKRGVLLIIYIDDILVLGRTKESCLRNVKMVLALLKRLGFVINEAKCNFTPSTSFTYLGCVWDTQCWRVKLKPKREESIRFSAKNLLQKRTVSVRTVARFVGKIQSAVGILPLARARSRALMYQFAAVCKDRKSYDKFMTVSDRAVQELQVWSVLPSGSSMMISTEGLLVVTVDTDASPEGYGWYWNNQIFSDIIPDQWRGFHINILELWTLRKFLDTEGSKLEDVVLCWRVDNNTALAAVKK